MNCRIVDDATCHTSARPLSSSPRGRSAQPRAARPARVALMWPVAEAVLPGRGRALVAARDIRAGETVLSEAPLLLFTQRAFASTACARCLRLLDAGAARSARASPSCVQLLYSAAASRSSPAHGCAAGGVALVSCATCGSRCGASRRCRSTCLRCCELSCRPPIVSARRRARGQQKCQAAHTPRKSVRACAHARN